MEYMIAIDLWLMGVLATLITLIIVAREPRFDVGPWVGLLASLLWFITWPLAAVVIARLRRMLPFAMLVRHGGGLPIICEVTVKTPSGRVMKDLAALHGAGWRFPE